jgi:hypothetical protein
MAVVKKTKVKKKVVAKKKIGKKKKRKSTSPLTKAWKGIEEVEAQIKELYAEKNERLQKLLKFYGPGKHFYPGEGDKPFVRVELVDYFQHPGLIDGGPVYKATGFNRYDITISRMKNKPKDWKD